MSGAEIKGEKALKHNRVNKTFLKKGKMLNTDDIVSQKLNIFGAKVRLNL